MMIDPSEKQASWLLPPRRKNTFVPGLYLVSTPIGNMGDITLRALDTLAAADLVVCEDTRVSGKLLTYYGLKKKLLPYNDHNAERQRGSILKALQGGQIVALISDAGTPLISDPGYKLVRTCIDEGIAVTSVPGANAVFPALQLAGLPTDAFYFGGFLSSKTNARRTQLLAARDITATLVFYETGPRVLKALHDIEQVLGNRNMAIAREMTKLYEDIRRGPVRDLISVLEVTDAPKGEIVLVVQGSEDSAAVHDPEHLLIEALETMSTKEAAAHVARITGQPRTELYNRALQIARET